MKKQLLWLLMAAPIGVWAQDAPYTVTGQLKNFTNESETVILYYVANGKRVMDSAKIEGGKYTFKGTVAEPTQANILGMKPGPRGVNPKLISTLFLEPGNIAVSHVDSFSNVVVTGSPATTEFNKLQKKLEPQNKEFQELMTAYRTAGQAGDKEGMAKAEAKLEKADSLMKETYLVYFNANPSSPIALYALSKYLPYDIDADKIDPLYNKLSAKNKQSAAGKDLKHKIDVARMTGIGKMAPDFTQNDTLDKPVQLSSFKGKYVLVDFWASWCGPCRKENPNVVKAYNAYKDKGFTVLGVSLDNPGAKDKWLKAIHDDGLTWTQVSDLQGWANAAAKSYGVQAIPQNFLVDPQGKIVGKNLRGEELDKKLAELL
jgi:peroxiredoxin